MTDRDVIALTLWGEARGESTAGRLAVACVMKNRVQCGRWGSSYESVCLAPKQFSCWNPGDPNRNQLQALLAALAAHEAVTDPILAECFWIADGVLSEALRPQVAHATHYYASSIHPPAWAQPPAELVAQIGHHLFFQHVAALPTKPIYAG